MEMTKEPISFTFDPRDMLLSLQMGFSFVRAAVACAILERTSGLEPSSETTAPRYLKLVTVLNFCPVTFKRYINFSEIFTYLSPPVTLKIRSRSPISNQLLSLS